MFSFVADYWPYQKTKSCQFSKYVIYTSNVWWRNHFLFIFYLFSLPCLVLGTYILNFFRAADRTLFYAIFGHRKSAIALGFSHQSSVLNRSWIVTNKGMQWSDSSLSIYLSTPDDGQKTRLSESVSGLNYFGKVIFSTLRLNLSLGVAGGESPCLSHFC